jgi:CheY-like chemotaxis protein
MATQSKILVVEDDRVLSALYKILLERNGYTVDVTESRRSSIDALQNKSYDLALVDLQLKDDFTHDGGLQVLDEINNLGEGTVSIVLSANPDVDFASAAWRRGGAEYLRKPTFGEDALIAAIQRALEGASRRTLGNYPSITAYLAAPQITPIWEDRIKEALRSDLQSVQRMIWRTFSNYLPVLRCKGDVAALEADPNTAAVGGAFWSKEIGGAIWISIESGGQHYMPPSGGENVAKIDLKNLRSSIWRIDAPREQFMEKIHDTLGR